MSDLDKKEYYSIVQRKDEQSDFHFLRLDSVDVMRYLPQFLAEERSVQDALSREHENLRLRIADVARQFFIETATWGLSSWERIYAVNPPAGADYALRRALVKAKMLGTGVMTVETIKHLCNAFLDKQDAEIDELPEPGTFYLITHSRMDYLNELIKVLSEMSPAHLVFGFRFVKEVDSTIYVGLLPSLHKRFIANPAAPDNPNVSAVVYASSKATFHRRITAPPRVNSINEARATPRMGGKVGVHIRVTGGVMKHV